MAIYTELQSSLTSSTVVHAHKKAMECDRTEYIAEEVLIPDDRGNLRPGQMVEKKLSGMLPGACLPVSQLRFSKLISRRS